MFLHNCARLIAPARPANTVIRRLVASLTVLFIACSAAGATPPGAAAGSGTVTGRVTFQGTGEPLSHVTVLIERLDRRTETDDDGRYQFTRVPPGTYHLVASMGGLTDAAREIVIEEGGEQSVDFDLRFIAIKPEITVTARGREELTLETVSSVTTLDTSQLELLAQPGIGEVLQHVPGVAKRGFGSPGTSRPIVRGFDGDRVLVMEDGHPTGTLSSQSGDHGETLDVANFERVEVVRGPATLLYGGNAIGGVINAVSPYHRFREGGHDGFQGGASLNFGSTADSVGGHAQLEFSSDDWRLWGGGGLQRTDSYDTPLGVVPNSDSELRNGFLGFGRYSERSFFSFGYRIGEGRYGVPFAQDLHAHDGDEQEIEEIEEIDIDSRLHTVRVAAGFGDLRGFMDRAQLSASFSDWKHTELEDGTPATKFGNRQFIYRATVDQTSRGALRGTSGIWGMHRDYEAIGEEALSPPVIQSGFAVFTLQEVSFGRGRLEIGARIDRGTYDPDADDHRERSFTGGSGSVGLHFFTWRDGAIVASYQHAYRPPALEELYNFGPHAGNASFEIGNEDLDAERSNGFEVSARHAGRDLQGSLSLFQYDIRNFIYLAPTGEERDGLPVGVYSQADGRYRGFEGKLEYAVSPWLSCSVGLDRVDAEIKETDLPLPRIPPLRAVLSTAFRTGGFTFEPELILAAEQDEVHTNETVTDGYSVLSLGVSYSKPIGNTIHRLTLRAFNLTDELYYNHSSFIKDRAPEIGRGVRFTYSVRVF